MGETTGIEWTDHTFNPWIGCTKVAPGCAHCYAERDFDKRRHFAQWGPNGTRVVTSEDNWKKPLKWNRDAEAAGVRSRVFCASLADVFEDWAGPMVSADGTGRAVYRSDAEPFAVETMQDVRSRLFAMIDATPWLDWQLVTKRPENVLKMWPTFVIPDRSRPSTEFSAYDNGHRPNVWLLTSISDQQTADAMIPALLECRDLVPVLGLSIEPMLGPADLLIDGECSDWACGVCGSRNVDTEVVVAEDDVGTYACRDCGYVGGGEEADWKSLIDWVIVGGESGPGARPMHPEWVRSLRDQCQAAGVPFFFKQWGEWLPLADTPPGTPSDAWIARDGRKLTPLDGVIEWGAEPVVHVGKKRAGRMLDGRDWSEFPEQKAVSNA